MKLKSVRTTVDLPPDLSRRLCEAASRRGCNPSQLIAEVIERVVAVPQPPLKGRLVLNRPLLGGNRNPIAVANEQIYEVGFP